MPEIPDHSAVLFPWINSPRLRRVERWLWKRPKAAIFLTFLSVAILSFPDWGNSIWYSFYNEPPMPAISKKLSLSLPSLGFSPYWITVPLGILMFAVVVYLLAMGRRASQTVDGQHDPEGGRAEDKTAGHTNQGIVCLDTDVIPFVFKNGSVPTRVETEGNDSFNAAIAEFVNNPNAQTWVATITYLEAQVTYYDLDGKFCHRVTRCFWMNEPESYIEEFGADAKGHLLIAVAVDDTICVAENIPEGESRDLYRLVADSYRVQVYLNKGGGTFSFDLICKPKLRLEEAGSNRNALLKTATSGKRMANVEVARRLVEFMEEGDTLLKREADFASWERIVKTHIEKTLGEFDAIEWSRPYPITAYPHGAINRHRVNRLYTLLQRLGELVTRLKHD